MPYTSASEVPSYVPKAKRKQWMEIWNSTYASAIEDGKSKDDAEQSAFAQANAVADPNSKKLFKFGTKDTGFTSGAFGPFKCGNCKFFETLEDYAICHNDEVADDPEVAEDSYSNKIVNQNDCCNEFTPVDEGEEEMLEAAKAAKTSLDEKLIFCPLVKVDEVKREVWGVVTAEVPDRDDEICDYETTVPYYRSVVDKMSKATDGANIFPLRVMHGLVAAGKGISIEFRKDAKEIYMGFKVVDDAEWKKVQESVYTGFSQGGRYIKKWKDGDFIRYTAQPSEVSLVDVPCLTRAHFEYVKSDGTHEIRKIGKLHKDSPLGDKAGELNATPTPVPSSEVEPPCTCDCEQCKKGNCAACTKGCHMKADQIDDLNKKEKKKEGVKYLVTEDEYGYLPYTRADGKPNHNLMGAAWAALFSSGGHRGNKYSGPKKEEAKRKLKALYRREKMETPTKKALMDALNKQKTHEDKVQKRIEGILTDVINNRAYGQLGKGMYGISRFAQIIEDLKYLWLSFEYEEDQEGDESPATDGVLECYTQLLDHLLAYTEEQITEAKEETIKFEAAEHA